MFSKEVFNSGIELSLVPWDCYSDECIEFSKKIKFDNLKNNEEIIAFIVLCVSKINNKQNIYFNYITGDSSNKQSSNCELIKFCLLHINVLPQITWKRFIQLIFKKLVNSKNFKNTNINKFTEENNISNISIVCSKIGKKALEILFVKSDILFVVYEQDSVIEIKSRFNIAEKRLVNKILKDFYAIAQN